MATVLLAWELGGGLGHLMRLRPIAERLAARGHRIVAVLRDLSHAGEFFSQPGMVCLQAPTRVESSGEIDPSCTFAQILHNCGFGESRPLLARAEAWRNLYEAFKADLIIFDHSPTALLAAQAFPAARRALVGTGFLSPPDITPLPNLRTWHDPDWPQLQIHEREVLANLNAVLSYWKLQPLERTAALFQMVDENFLLTFREIDFYPRPEGTVFWGAWSAGMGGPPEWPAGRGKRVFAYLKPFAALPQLLSALCGLPNPALIYAPGIDARLRDYCRTPNVRFAEGPVEMSRAAEECDVAILNGTHATTVAMLLAGKPALHIPLFLEQALNARAVQRIGAGICAPPTEPQAVTTALRRLLSDDRFGSAAHAFAAKYADYNPELQIQRLVDSAEELATSSAT